MSLLQDEEVIKYIENAAEAFNERRIEILNNLSFFELLKNQNPYYSHLDNQLTTEQIVRNLIDPYIALDETTIGDWLEGLAIFINNKVYGGWKSGVKGIDLEFNKEGVRYIVAIKSGPNWGNNSQIARMKTDFTTAKKTLRTSDSGLMITAVNGCCYGKQKKTDRGEYYKYCGQDFWEFISGDSSLYKDLIEPIGHKAKEKNESFMLSYAKTINKFTKTFANEFCKDNGAIDWKKLLEFNSGREG